MVADTHAIVDPGAVMIESLYTLMAPCTVSTSYCPQDLAFGAQLGRVEVFNQPNEFHPLFDVARVLTVGNSEEQQGQDTQSDAQQYHSIAEV